MTNEQPMAAIDIIRETVYFYFDNPRSVTEEGQCMYRGGEDRSLSCAFSRCLTTHYRDAAREGSGCNELQCWMQADGLLNQDAMQPRYRGHPIEFWQGLQILHDYETFWREVTEGGGRVWRLTDEGSRYREILEAIFKDRG